VDKSTSDNFHQTGSPQPTQAAIRLLDTKCKFKSHMACHLQPNNAGNLPTPPIPTPSSILYPPNHEIPPFLLHHTTHHPKPHQLSLNHGIPTSRISHWKPSSPYPSPHTTPSQTHAYHHVRKLRKLLPTYAPTLWTQLTLTANHSGSYLAYYISQNQGQLLIIAHWCLT